MDIKTQQLRDKRQQGLQQLIKSAAGLEFKQLAEAAIKVTGQSAATYNRLQRTYTVFPNDQDHKRVKAGKLSTKTVQFSGSANGGDTMRSYTQAAIASGSLSANVKHTSDDVAVASRAPQAINMLALLHTSILSKDPIKGKDYIFNAANVLGLMATSAGYATTGGLSAFINGIAAGATYTGGLSLIAANAPDGSHEAIKNYVICLNEWNRKACALIESADPNGQWSYRDFH